MGNNEQRKEILEKNIKIANQRLAKLEEAFIIETNPSQKIETEKYIKDAKKDIDKFEKELEELQKNPPNETQPKKVEKEIILTSVKKETPQKKTTNRKNEIFTIIFLFLIIVLIISLIFIKFRNEPKVYTFIGHSFKVNSIDFYFSANGNKTMISGGGSTIKMWDLKTQEEIKTFKGHLERINSVAFSEDGKYIISGSQDTTIKLWDVETGEEIRTFNGHFAGVSSVAFSSDGKKIISVADTNGDDKTTKIWDVETGEEIKTLFNGRVTSVAFSPNGKQRISVKFVKNNHTIKLYNWDSNELIQTFLGHTSGIKSIAFSPDGKKIVSASHDKTIRMWDVKTGENIKNYNDKVKEEIRYVCFTPDGKEIWAVNYDFNYDNYNLEVRIYKFKVML